MVAVKTIVSSVLGSVGDMGNTALQNRGARDVARINEADDVTSTGFNQEVLNQLQQALSKVDKNTLESVLGTTVTDEQMKSLQTSTGSSNTSTTGQEKTTQTVTRGDANQQAALGDLVKSLSGGNNGNADFQAAMNQVLRSGMPAMANVGNSAGTFDDTTAALLQQDLAIKAAEAGLGAQNQAKQANNAQLIEALKLGQSGTETSVGDLQRQQQELALQQQQQQTQQQNTSNQTTDQTRNSQESGTTSTTTQNQSTGTTVNQEFQDVAKDKSAPPTTGPLAQILAGQPVTPVNTGQPMLPAPAPGTAPAPTQLNAVMASGNPLMANLAQPAVMQPTTKPMAETSMAPTTSNGQMFMARDMGPTIGMDGANPLASALGTPSMINASAKMDPAMMQMGSMQPIPTMNTNQVAQTAQAQSVPQQQQGTVGAVQQVNPISQVVTGKMDPFMTDPIMAPLPVSERRAII